MKIDFVEVCGFRGFRDKLRIDFGAGFTVISGRNGVGKSTICDSIEFALTGGIDKYRVEKAGKESLDDYIWWRGTGAPKAHYVAIGFSADDGSSFTITRARESGADRTDDEIESALCRGAKPDRALKQLCRTSIIRDEWIAALSLDLTETERFEFVRMALGTVEGPDYAIKAKKVLASTQREHQRIEKIYQEDRQNLNNALTQLSEARNAAVTAEDVSGAIAILDAKIDPSDGDLVERISKVRPILSVDRMRLNAIGEAILEGREIKAFRAKIDGSAFQEQKKSALKAVDEAKITLNNARAAMEETQHQFDREKEADMLASSLAALVKHGTHLGLDDGHCPLCAAVRNQEEFAEGIARARDRIKRLGSGITAAQQALTEAHQASTDAEKQLAKIEVRLAEITAQENGLFQREAKHISLFQEHNLNPALATDPDALERQLNIERSRLIDLERAILTLEASQSVERITNLEVRISSLRENVENAANRLGRMQTAVALARSMEHGVRRTSAEIIDERLALISPLLNELYQRLRPHADWRSIEYSVRGDVRRFLSLRVGDGLNPQFVFSSGQRRAAGLAFLLSVHLSRTWSRLNTLVLDDPVQHIDDFRALHLVEILAAIRQDQRQIICAVEDASLADLLCRRLFSTSEEPGRRYDLDYDPSGNVAIADRVNILPMSPDVLQPAWVI